MRWAELSWSEILLGRVVLSELSLGRVVLHPISHPGADEVLTHARFSYRYSLRERFRTHKVFTKDQCFYLIIISSP